MVKPQEKMLDVLIPASKLTATTATTIGNILADNGAGLVALHVLLDGDSDSDTRKIKDVFGASVNWILNGGEPKGPAWARNRLAQASTAPFLAFIDSDVLIPPQFCSRVMQTVLHLRTGEVLAPRIDPTRPNNLVSRYFSSFVLGPSVVSGQLICPTAALFLSRETWLQALPFREAFATPGGEDWDWFARNESVIEVTFEPSLVVAHENPTSLQALLGRAWRYGRQENLIHRERALPANQSKSAIVEGGMLSAEGTVRGLFRGAKESAGRAFRWRKRVLYDVSVTDLPLFLFLLVVFRLVYRCSHLVGRIRARTSF